MLGIQQRKRFQAHVTANISCGLHPRSYTKYVSSSFSTWWGSGFNLDYHRLLRPVALLFDFDLADSARAGTTAMAVGSKGDVQLASSFHPRFQSLRPSDDPERGGIPEDLVLYSRRHTFGTKLLESTGNLSLVTRALGHSSAQTTMIHRHPDLEIIRTVMDGDKDESRPRHNSRHSDAA